MPDPALMRATEDGARPAAIPQALVPALRRLDAAIEPLIRATQAAGGIAAASLRGMYVSAEEAARLLARAPATPVFDARQRNGAGLAGPAAAAAPFDLLQQWFALSDFDLDAVVIALAPELDLRYERLYGYLQDDVTRRGPTVDLVLNLRTSSAQEKIAGLAPCWGSGMSCTTARKSACRNFSPSSPARASAAADFPVPPGPRK
jgi:hypothetical protein